MKGDPVRKKITLHRETLRGLGTAGGELRQAKGGISTTCPVPTICKPCPTHIGYPTCYKTCP
ncbi:MAG TPA: hypothetical protein VKY89_19620 [Thermoanaerobaculia bacterium]|nr:hypothetical protein [Thermoanaerobaculia bacterium]